MQWVREVLVAEGLVSPIKKKKFNCKKEDHGILLVTVWTKDDVQSVNDRCRIQFTFVLQLYASSGARVAAFFEEGIGIPWRVSCSSNADTYSSIYQGLGRRGSNGPLFAPVTEFALRGHRLCN